MKKQLAFVTIIAAIVGCQKNLDVVDGDYPTPNLPQQSYSYVIDRDVVFPDHVTRPSTSKTSSVTDAGATLGRVLFYDKALSLNNSTACASCHLQHKGFADGKKLSTGFNSGVTKRNSPSVVNMIFQSKFFWDGRASSLQQQVLMPIQDHIEMGLDDTIYMVKKVNELPYYRALFLDAFGSDQASMSTISSAMAQFIHSMISVDSKFDRGEAIEFANLTLLEKEGLELFSNSSRTHCGSCHSINFGGWSSSFANVGLDMNYTDPGRAGLPGLEPWEGFFKIPSLRNVELTAPYMHDGRFETLREVIDHYDSGVQPHPSLDWRMTNQSNIVFFEDFNSNNEALSDPWRLNLTEREKDALVAFLKTLTDRSLEMDPRFSDPFN